MNVGRFLQEMSTHIPNISPYRLHDSMCSFFHLNYLIWCFLQHDNVTNNKSCTSWNDRFACLQRRHLTSVLLLLFHSFFDCFDLLVPLFLFVKKVISIGIRRFPNWWIINSYKTVSRVIILRICSFLAVNIFSLSEVRLGFLYLKLQFAYFQI